MWPDALQGGAMAMLSEIARWFWLLPQLPAGNLLQPGTSSMASKVAEAQKSTWKARCLL
jgi:hypothetical protein